MIIVNKDGLLIDTDPEHGICMEIAQYVPKEFRNKAITDEMIAKYQSTKPGIIGHL